MDIPALIQQLIQAIKNRPCTEKRILAEQDRTLIGYINLTRTLIELMSQHKEPRQVHAAFKSQSLETAIDL